MTKPWSRVIEYWFKGLHKNDNGVWQLPAETIAKHWNKNPKVDLEIKQLFEEDVKKTIAGGYEEWNEHPQGLLARIILCDQMTRNMYRDTPAAFSGDELAFKLSKLAWEKRFDKLVTKPEVSFFYLPLMHVETLEGQALGIKVVSEVDRENLYWQQLHYNLVESFGRFPHRNVILGRESTPEELIALKDKKNSF